MWRRKQGGRVVWIGGYRYLLYLHVAAGEVAMDECRLAAAQRANYSQPDEISSTFTNRLHQNTWRFQKLFKLSYLGTKLFYSNCN